MRQAALIVLLVTALGPASICASAGMHASPPEPTARCVDGTLSHAQHHSGACSHHGGVAKWLDGPASQGSGASSAITLGSTVVISRRSAVSGCTRGPAPDRRCSPGGYCSALTRRVICTAGFRTGSIRSVSQDRKFAVERAYEMAARLYGSTIEIDHIIPLELGGSNATSNLFPESGTATASYHVKDRLENRLHDMVCAGQIALRAAQTSIATDWRSLYRRIFGTAPLR
jgi:hypothetical protein